MLQMVARNMAYYLHVQRQALYDLGYEIIPEFPQRENKISEIIIYTHNYGALLMLIPLLFIERKPKTPYFVNICIRLLYILTLGHTLRAFSYLTTSLPGQAEQCQPESPDYDPPQDMIEVWFGRFAGPGHLNCGDLLFSGHIMHHIIFSFIITKYTPLFLSPAISLTFIIYE